MNKGRIFIADYVQREHPDTVEAFFKWMGGKVLTTRHGPSRWGTTGIEYVMESDRFDDETDALYVYDALAYCDQKTGETGFRLVQIKEKK